MTRDLWLYEPQSGRHQQLTNWKGEDRQPAFVDGGKAIAFLSERGGGSFNVYQMTLGPASKPGELVAAGEPAALTHFTTHPVRYLSSAANGTLAFNVLGDLYVMAPGGEPRKLEVAIYADRQANEKKVVSATDGATEFAISPLGDEVAFVVRGEISRPRSSTAPPGGSPTPRSRSARWPSRRTAAPSISRPNAATPGTSSRSRWCGRTRTASSSRPRCAKRWWPAAPASSSSR